MKSVERTPFALLLGGSWALNTQNLPFEAVFSRPTEDIIVDAYQKAGSDIVWAAPGSGNLIVQAFGGELKFRRTGPPDVINPVIKESETLENIDIEQFKKDLMLQRIMEITKRILEKNQSRFCDRRQYVGALDACGASLRRGAADAGYAPY
jgi:hypothetical protein